MRKIDLKLIEDTVAELLYDACINLGKKELKLLEKAKLEEKILAKFGLKSAELKEVVDPSIIGGVIVEANHQVIDGSLKTQLENIKAKLL